jgi:serine/threonine protein kinase
MSDLTSRLSTALADRYKIEDRLGEGGMATVYLAEDLKLHPARWRAAIRLERRVRTKSFRNSSRSAEPWF